MHIEQSHTLGQSEAIRRVDRVLDELAAQPPGGVTVRDARKEWSGGRMTFAFTAGKGPFGVTIRGVMDVTDDRVVVESDLPGLIKSVLGESRVQEVVGTHLEKVLRP